MRSHFETSGQSETLGIRSDMGSIRSSLVGLISFRLDNPRPADAADMASCFVRPR